MYIKRFLSVLIVCMLLAGAAPSAAAIDRAVYDAYAAQERVLAHPAEDAGPRSFMTAASDAAAKNGAAFHPYVFTVHEDATVSASVQLQPTLMLLPAGGALSSEKKAVLYNTPSSILEGEGTDVNPYILSTKAHLEAFRDIVNNGASGADAVLMNDIDLEDSAWTPIDGYAGCFNGGGHEILGLNATGENAGLFGTIANGSVERLGVQGSVAASAGNDTYAGGIAAVVEGGTLSECWFSGTVSAAGARAAYAGGIVGSLFSGGMTNCWSAGAVHAKSAVLVFAGGVAGFSDGELCFCYHAEGNVTAEGDAKIGGIAGDGGGLLQCYYQSGTASGGVGGADTEQAKPLTAAEFAETESFFEIDTNKTWDFDDTWYMDEESDRPMLRCGKTGLVLELQMESVYELTETVPLIITLSDGNAAGGVITVTVIGVENDEYRETYTVEPVGGKATQIITVSGPGNYILSAEYSGDSKHWSCANSTVFEVRASYIDVYSWDGLQDAAQTGKMIILRRNMTCAGLNMGRIVIPENANATIDLNGYMIDRAETNQAVDGGVIYLSRHSNLTIMDSVGTGVITGGSTTGSGGAIVAEPDVNLTVTNVAFINNTAREFGGAIFTYGEANITLINATFRFNRAATGGAIYTNGGANVCVINGTLENNYASTGGAIYLNGDASAAVNRASFENNNATTAGAIYADQISSLAIENCDFINNTAENFAAVHMPNTDTLINRSVFVGNTAVYGVVGHNWNDTGSSMIRNCIFLANDVNSDQVAFQKNENKTICSSWYGSTADNYDSPPQQSASTGVNNWNYLSITRTIDEITGQYAFSAALGQYDPNTNNTVGVDPSDYELPDIALDSFAQGAKINETNVIQLSRSGYTKVVFTPQENATTYTVGVRFHGLPIIIENQTFERTIKVNGGQGLEFNDINNSTVNLTALENLEAVPNVVLAGKTVSLACEDMVNNYTITSEGTFQMGVENLTPGMHVAVITVAGFKPANMTITAPKYHSTIEAETPDTVFIGENVTIGVRISENANGNITLNVSDGGAYNETFIVEPHNGAANQTISGLAIGTYTVSATYDGDNNYTGNSTAVSFTVLGIPVCCVTVAAEPAAGGSVTGAGNYTAGASVTVTAEPNTGYDFVSWTENGTAVSGNASYAFTAGADRALTAGFALKTFAVCFLGENGTVLQNSTVAYGTTPEYIGAAPTKAEDAQYTYTFNGWTPALGPVTEAVSYTATFNATEKQMPAPDPEPDDSEPTPAETRFDVVDTGKGVTLENFKRSRTYTNGTFSDVNPEGWYFENIAAAFEYAFMEGMGDGTFGVGAHLKLSETLALACRLHNIYYGGSGKFDQTRDENWYTVYEDYAVKYGIIGKGEYDLTGNATRAQVAAILSAALPDAALKPINNVTALPDVGAGDPRLPAIVRLYNAGILTGMNAEGDFQPDAFILREQAAAMVTRVADPALRKVFTLS